MQFIQMLVDFECVGFMVEFADQSLMQGRQDRARDVHNGSIDLRDGSDLLETLSRSLHEVEIRAPRLPRGGTQQRC
jgi:hypothetical protein